jgi:phage/plasmid-associated DNA primase
MDEQKIFNWKLNEKMFKTSIFLKKNMKENPSLMNVLGYIKDEMGNTPLRRMNMKLPYKTELEMMKAYKKKYTKGSFYIKIVLSKHKWGRTLPVDYLSLSIMKRSVRHSLCDGIYMDIDMENAQPSILYQIAKQNNMECKILKKYVENPKKYRALIMDHHNCDKDVAKKLPISLIMGGTYEGWIKEFNVQVTESLLKEFVEMETEMMLIMEVVYNMNPHIKKDVLKENPTKWKNINEEKRGVMGLWCQSIEKLFQETAIEAILSNEIFIEDIIPSQDGFMILKDLYDDELLKVCQKAIKEAFDINIIFTNKPFDEKFVINPYTEGLKKSEWVDIISVKKLADSLLKLKGDNILRNNDNLFIYYEKRWYNETVGDKRYKFMRYISEDLYDYMKNEIETDISLDENEIDSLLAELRRNTSSSSKMKDVMGHTLSKAKESKEPFDSKPFLIGFDNGVIDLLECSFDDDLKICFKDYTFNDYITMTCGYDYKPNEDIDKRQVLADLITSIQPKQDERDYLLQILASGLDGRAYQKIHFFNGLGGNGKGLIGGLMSEILGDYYHQPGNGILKDIEKANVPSPDMINLKNKRYINFKELEGNIRLPALKNLTGEGEFSGRYLNQNPEKFKMTSTWVAEFNNPPDIDGKPQPADYRRMVDVCFPSNFTDDEDKIGKTINGISYQRGNDYFTTPEFRKEYKYVFLELLIGIYCQFQDKEIKTKGIKFTVPASIKERTSKLMDGFNLFHKITKDLWELGDGEKKIGLKEIWDSIKEHPDYKALTTRLKKQYSRDEYYSYLQGVFKVDETAQRTKYIIGLKQKDLIEEELN